MENVKELKTKHISALAIISSIEILDALKIEYSENVQMTHTLNERREAQVNKYRKLITNNNE
jgi:hypothetical protein